MLDNTPVVMIFVVPMTHDPSRRNTRGEFDGDGPWSTPDVEEIQPWPEMAEQVPGRVLCATCVSAERSHHGV